MFSEWSNHSRQCMCQVCFVVVSAQLTIVASNGPFVYVSCCLVSPSTCSSFANVGSEGHHFKCFLVIYMHCDARVFFCWYSVFLSCFCSTLVALGRVKGCESSNCLCLYLGLFFMSRSPSFSSVLNLSLLLIAASL